MRASTIDPFDDDGADWIAELIEEPAVERLRETFQAVEDEAERLECGSAVAAAEVVAGALGHPSKELLERLQLLTDIAAEEDDEPGVDPALLIKLHASAPSLAPPAIAAIDRILESGELAELWDEVDGTWRARTLELRKRLSLPPKKPARLAPASRAG